MHEFEAAYEGYEAAMDDFEKLLDGTSVERERDTATETRPAAD